MTQETTSHRPETSARPSGSETPPTELSTVQLVERLTQQVSALVRTEISAGLEEVKGKTSRFSTGIGVSGAGALLLLFGFGTLIAAAVLGLSNAVQPWLAALIVGGVLVLGGAVFAAVGRSQAKKAMPPVPEDTAHSVNEDIAAVRRSVQ